MNGALASAHRHQDKLATAAAEISLHDLAAHAGNLSALASCLKAEQMHFMSALKSSGGDPTTAHQGDQMHADLRCVLACACHRTLSAQQRCFPAVSFA